MKKGKLGKLLECCEPAERRAFRQWAAGSDSPVHPQSLRLWDLLIGPDGKWQAKPPGRETLHAQLFPGQAYAAQPVRDAYSRLYRHLRDFLGRHWTGEAASREAFLSEMVRRAELGLFTQEHRRWAQALDPQTQTAEQDFYHRYQLASLRNEAFGQAQVRRQDHNLPEKLAWLDQFYLCVKLRESCELLNRLNIVQGEAPLPLLEALLPVLAQPDHPYRQVPAIDVYYHIYLTLAEPEQAGHYDRLLAVLDRHRDRFLPAEARAMYKYAQNYCIRHVNQGSQPWLEALFQLYRHLLDRQLIFHDGLLAHTDYKNIATAGLRLQAYDWVRDFIHRYREQVPPPYGEPAFRYTLAACYFEEGDAGTALRLLQEAEPADVHYQLSFRHLQAKIYYQQGDFEALFYQLDAFRRFLTRSRALGTPTRRSHAQFVRLLRQAGRLAAQRAYLEPGQAQHRQTRLRDKLYASPEVADRSWLEKVVEKLAVQSRP